MGYTRKQCRSALHHITKSRMPYEWDLNAYQGCEHGCRYCFAQYTAKYRESDDFYHDIIIKENVAEQLEKELKSPKWKREVVNLGGVTDSYQPIEKEQKTMRKVLQLLIETRTPCIISTKSDLILRDKDLLVKLAELTYVNVASTILTTDDELGFIIEPGAVSVSRRMAMLKEFRDTPVNTGLHAMPILPYLTDADPQLDSLYAAAKDAGVDYLLPGTLRLSGKSRQVYFKMIADYFCELDEATRLLYRNPEVKKEYCRDLYSRIAVFQRKYQLFPSYLKKLTEQLKPGSNFDQIPLFK